MTRRHFKTLQRRREALLVRCHEQRDALGEQERLLLRSVSVLDIGLNVLAKVRKHPVWVSGVLAGLVVLKPRRMFVLLQVGMLTKKVVQTVRPTLEGWWQRVFDKAIK